MRVPASPLEIAPSSESEPMTTSPPLRSTKRQAAGADHDSALGEKVLDGAELNDRLRVGRRDDSAKIRPIGCNRPRVLRLETQGFVFGINGTDRLRPMRECLIVSRYAHLRQEHGDLARGQLVA
jgi:hypothetical protein